MDEIETIEQDEDGEFELPKSRIGCVTDARGVITSLVQAEETRSIRRSKFKGMLGGNPPWNPQLLESKGMSDRANFSLREAEGFLAAAKTPYYRLFFTGIDLRMEYGEADIQMLTEFATKVATRYGYMIDDWNGLDMRAQRSHYQMIAHGSGPFVWEDTKDWRSDSWLTGQFLLPDDASADIEEWETAGYTRSYLPSFLWKKIQNESSAKAEGWNVEAVKREIMNAAPENMVNLWGSNFEAYDAEIRKGVTGFDSKCKRIFIGGLFQREFNGKISHFIIPRSPDGQVPEPVTTPVTATTDEDDDEGEHAIEGFLFRKLERFKSFCEITVPFIYDVGDDGDFQSVKGAGPKVFDFCASSDRLTMRALDGAMKASGIIVKASNANALQESAFTDTTGGTVIGPGYEAMQQRVAPDLQSPLLMKRDLHNTLSENTGQYRQRVNDENPEPTLGQAQLNAQQQATLGEGDANRYYRQLDRWHRETFRRALKMGRSLYERRKDLAPDEDGEYEDGNLTESERGALKFYRNLVTLDNIPEEFLKFSNFCVVRAKRLLGNGSNQMRQIISNDLMGLVPLVNERGRNIIIRNKIAASAGDEWADAIEPPYGTPQIDDGHIALATLENNILRMPMGEVAVGPGQDDVTHFGIHAQGVGKHAAMVKAGQADPHALLIHLNQAGPHMLEHLGKVANDPTRKTQVKAMGAAFMNMSKFSDQLTQQIEAMDAAAAAQQPPQQPDPKVIIGLAEVAGNLKIKETKMRGDMQIKAEKQKIQNRLSDLETSHSMNLASAEAATSIRNDTVSTLMP